MTALGIDLYHGDDVVSFHNVATAGVQFVFLKSSEGLSEKDPLYDNYAARCDIAALLRGAYHFFDEAEPIGQAQWFMQCANLVTGNLIPVLDVETAFPSVGASALQCANEVKRLCGHFPILYSGVSFYETFLQDVFPSETTLWLAEYGVVEPKHACDLWQYSETGTVSGINGNVDMDRCYVDLTTITMLATQ